jgi:hypothetical protein
MEEPKKTSCARYHVMTKKRYNDIGDMLGFYIGDKEVLKHVMDEISNIMEFDFTKSTYTKEFGLKQAKWRKKKGGEPQPKGPARANMSSS